MRPNELPTHKQHEARVKRLQWLEKHGVDAIGWTLLAILGVIMLLDFLGVI